MIAMTIVETMRIEGLPNSYHHLHVCNIFIHFIHVTTTSRYGDEQRRLWISLGVMWRLLSTIYLFIYLFKYT